MTAPHYTVPDVDAAQRLIERLRALTPEQWEEFARSLDVWRGDEIGKVWRRARRRTLAHPGPVFLREVQQVFITIGELIAELGSPFRPTSIVESLRARLPEMPPSARPVFAMHADLMEVAEQALPGDRLASDELVIAGEALLWRPRLRPADFAEAYAPLGPFVPADSVSDVA